MQMGALCRRVLGQVGLGGSSCLSSSFYEQVSQVSDLSRLRCRSLLLLKN